MALSKNVEKLLTLFYNIIYFDALLAQADSRYVSVIKIRDTRFITIRTLINAP